MLGRRDSRRALVIVSTGSTFDAANPPPPAARDDGRETTMEAGAQRSRRLRAGSSRAARKAPFDPALSLQTVASSRFSNQPADIPPKRRGKSIPSLAANSADIRMG